MALTVCQSSQFINSKLCSSGPYVRQHVMEEGNREAERAVLIRDKI